MKHIFNASFRFQVFQFVVMLSVVCLCGCRTAKSSNDGQMPVGPSQMKYFTDGATRGNCIALLDDLLNEEKHLGKMLIIKWESPKLEQLVKDISQTAGEGADYLKTFRLKERRDDAPPTHLPPGEKAVREAIAKTKQKNLLESKGTEFEFQLLLTQVQALNYGLHLAKVIAENEAHPERVHQFTQLAMKLKTLHDRVIEMLKERA